MKFETSMLSMSINYVVMDANLLYIISNYW